MTPVLLRCFIEDIYQVSSITNFFAALAQSAMMIKKSISARLRSKLPEVCLNALIY